MSNRWEQRWEQIAKKGLVEFLLARIAEDEEMAHDVQSYLSPKDTIDVFLTRREGDESRSKVVRPYDPARALADCKAKREIVDLIALTDSPACHVDAWTVAKRAVRAIAMIYAEHPDFREEWAA